MANTPGPEVQPELLAPLGSTSVAPDRWVSELSTLLHQLQDVSAAGSVLPPLISHQADNQLVQVRLGMASSLFAALRCKHSATAGHALRVALSCSAWALKMELPADRRDAIEVAGLLHDIGMIGVPDHILSKPGALDSDETTIIERSRRLSLEILRHSCASAEILQIVENVPAWYNGAQKGFSVAGEQIPLGARMLCIAEAFDAMTTDHVYRPAMSHDLALAELFACAGTQFDPELVRQFAELLVHDQADLHREAAGRWLRALDPQLVNSYWQLNCVPSQPSPPEADTLFQAKLLDNMYDAVVFVDAGLRVILWNHGAERLTGITSISMRQRRWQSDILKMCDEKGQTVAEDDCPIRCAIYSGVQSLRRMTISGRGGRPISVDTHTIPVAAEDGTILGATLLMHDASSETSLEQRCQNLYEKATKDALTQVANRAEFERVHAMFVAAHQQQQVPCSMMICDLDRFKLVNDTYGHQAGDDAIKSLATLLKTSCRPGDLVARYGGEEFVMLYADCDNATAARRAEQIRKALSQMPQPKLDGRPVTASFGVTEVQPGDTPETMLRRADRALLMAKSKGRNYVVQLGVGCAAGNPDDKAGSWSRKSASPNLILEQDLVTPVPIKIAIEKLRGFVADHQAKIVAIEGNNVRLELTDSRDSWMRRRSDRSVGFYIDLRFEEQHVRKEGSAPGSDVAIRTKIHVGLSPRKSRDRRHADVDRRAREILISFRSYLMATEADSDPPTGVFRRVKRVLGPWLTNS